MSANESGFEVHKHDGRKAVALDRMYLPVDPDFLLPGSELGFNLFGQKEAGTLQMLLSHGEKLKRAVWERLGDAANKIHLYVRADQRDEFVHYQEASLNGILESKDVLTEKKCEMLQTLTTSISKDLFDKPESSNIIRQREQVSKMTDFVTNEPSAMKSLLKLTSYDYSTYTHSVNVGLYSLAIAVEYLGGDVAHNMEEVAAGFFLHDIGKCRVNPDIINKPGRLTEEERKEVIKHPEFGRELLIDESNLSPEVAIIVAQHHERMDGLGYPDALAGEEIHLYARICSTADVYDALTTKRSYKEAMSPFEALKIMREGMYAQFDKDIFETFVLLMMKGAHMGDARKTKSVRVAKLK